MTNLVDSRLNSPNCTLLGCDGFGIKLSEDGGIVTVTVTGEVDLATAPLLRRALGLAASAAGDPAVVVIDACELSFIGTYGLGVILGARRTLQTRSGTLAIRNPSRMLQRTLSITRLTDLMAT